jgi:tRNA pseudouridine55 synthase
LKGIINVLKPPGMTSHDVIGFMRKLLNIKKIGYAGTLDPVAAGVLPVFIGKATKAIEFFDDNYKEYVAGCGSKVKIVGLRSLSREISTSCLINF